MSASKDLPRKTWKIYLRYTDWKGEKKIHTKRGFRTKKEALEYEREFLATKTGSLQMPFKKFVELYLETIKPQVKYNSYLNKCYMINTKILPYFQHKNIEDIKAIDIIQWQNELKNEVTSYGKPYTESYLRTINNQLNAIFNNASKYYDLKDNPIKKVNKMGKSKSPEMLFWTKEEYLKFIETMKSKPRSYYAFEVLYWCGLRIGELLALTKADINFDKKELYIRKSYQKLEGKVYITSPKTDKSIRTIQIPDFLCEELQDYLLGLEPISDDMRIFDFSKSYLTREMKRGSEEANVKRIRVHDLRHSHVAYLMELGFTPLVIAERLGHESIDITLRYAHLYPEKQQELAQKLHEERG